MAQLRELGNDSDGVLVLGATSMPWEADPAFLRCFEVCYPQNPNVYYFCFLEAYLHWFT